MKKRAALLALSAITLAAAAAGCGRGDGQVKDNNTGMAGTEDAIDHTGTEAAVGTENGTSQLQLGNAVEIPVSFDGQLAETDAHERLERVITAYCNVPEEEYGHVRYYYNYVDLNGDSKNEILALVLGKDVEGIKGNVLLWMDAEDSGAGADAVWQAFKNVGTPIYISNHMTGGYRDLIIPEDANVVAGTEGAGLDTVGGVSIEEQEEAVSATTNGTGVEGIGAGSAGADAAGTDAAGGSNPVEAAAQSDTSGADGLAPASVDQQYRLLLWNGERYQRIEEGQALFSLAGYEGLAILTNNIESDLVNDNYHFLGEAMR